MERLYTVAEANARLPELTALLEGMREQAQQLAALEGKAALIKKKLRGNGHHDPNEDSAVTGLANKLEDEIRRGIEKLAAWGIELKDLGVGLIDFPALREGRVVYLCWQLGEPEVAYWHETSTGFAGRQPLDDRLA